MAHNAAAEIFKTYRVRLLRFIRSRTRLVEDAEDILQDVFYQFARINALAQPIEQTAAWLYRAARNRIIDKSRKKKDEPLSAYYDEKEDEYIFVEIGDIIYGENATPETDYLRLLILEEIESRNCGIFHKRSCGKNKYARQYRAFPQALRREAPEKAA